MPTRRAGTRRRSASRCARTPASSPWIPDGELRAENDSLLDLVVDLTSAGQNLEQAIDDLELSTGFAAVTGPGLRVTVDDQPEGDPDGRVRATDLRSLVNGLWQAGAEAIAINGRLLIPSARS